MGEFKTSFNSICNRDLKHIYSGFPQVLKYRHSAPYPTQEQLRKETHYYDTIHAPIEQKYAREGEKEENHELKTFVLKSSEFVPEYNCLIPRAPAFRLMSRHEMKSVMERVTKPTVASQGISHSSDREMLASKEREHSKYLGLRSVNEREMTMINERLTRPTQSSRIREYQTKSKLVSQ